MPSRYRPAPTSGGRGASRSRGSRDGMPKACEPNMPNVVDAKGWFSLFTRTRYQYGSLETKERKNLTLGANANAERSRYEQEEMPERYSTRAAYQSYIKNQIRPRWADTPMSAVKLMAVEDWLKNLALAPKTKSHVRSQNPSGSRSGTVPLVVAVDPGAVPDNGADRGLFGPAGQRDRCTSMAGLRLSWAHATYPKERGSRQGRGRKDRVLTG